LARCTRARFDAWIQLFGRVAGIRDVAKKSAFALAALKRWRRKPQVRVVSIGVPAEIGLDGLLAADGAAHKGSLAAL
jgi:hypothetical protein